MLKSKKVQMLLEAESRMLNSNFIFIQFIKFSVANYQRSHLNYNYN